MGSPEVLWPIYVASKGRQQALRVPIRLPVSVVVEPQDRAGYEALWPEMDFLTLPENDQGLAYVRNWIHHHACMQGHPWYWMLDDDISGFYRIDNRRAVRCEPVEALMATQRLAMRYELVGQAALEYRQLAWAATAPALNSYADVCVAINAKLAGHIKFRQETDLKVDRDFTLRILSAGLWTVRNTRYAFSAPENGTNRGGLADAYATEGREEASAIALAKLWPGVVKVQRKRNNRVDAIINWRMFKVREVVK